MWLPCRISNIQVWISNHLDRLTEVHRLAVWFFSACNDWHSEAITELIKIYRWNKPDLRLFCKDLRTESERELSCLALFCRSIPRVVNGDWILAERFSRGCNRDCLHVQSAHPTVASSGEGITPVPGTDFDTDTWWSKEGLQGENIFLFSLH